MQAVQGEALEGGRYGVVFARSPQALWPRSAGRLHVYVYARQVAELAAAYQDALVTSGMVGLSRQPAQWLHVTVQDLGHDLQDLPAAKLARLTEGLRGELSQVPAFALQVGPAICSATAVEMDAVPDEPWRVLRAAVRRAAIAVLGEQVVPPMLGAGRPHVAIGYATCHIVLEPHLAALNYTRPGRGWLEVSAAYLVAVRQHPDEGFYSWQEVAALPLG